jgi:hypothetical protein
MRKAVFLANVIFFFPLLLLAAGGDYAVSKIPAALMENANVVKRFEEERFTLKNPGEAYYKWKFVLTILNENGDRYAGLSQLYNKFIEIKSIDAVLYDANGKELRKLKNRDIQDFSGSGDYSLVDDSRYKSHNFYYKVYPYTIEYEVELKYNGTMFYPDWLPQSWQHCSVEESRFVFSCDDNYEFRYKAYQYNNEPLITKDKNTKTYTWQIQNLPAISREPYSGGMRKITPLVLFGPTEFEMQNYKGNMKSWQDLGKFIYALKEGRDALPDDVKQTVHQLTDNVKDNKRKVEILYDYLQKNTRYISIQLGIGGWQPFDAKFVATKKYGDCKALSNFMYSLLKEAGIPSNYTVIRAGDDEDDIFSDFPASQFNHVILCVPLQKDTVWLECTDQYKSPGYMGAFTGNRYALVVDEKGGTLVSTPYYGMKDNQQLRTVKAVLENNGTLQLKANTHYSALQQDDIQGMITHLSRDRVKEYLHEQLDFATYDINRFDYKEEKQSLPAINESLDITVSNYATITGKRLFIVPNVMTKTYRKLSIDTARKYDIELGIGYMDVDSVEIELPAGYETEAMPQDVSISAPFGKYTCSVRLKDNKLQYFRSIESSGGHFSAKNYNDLVKFYETIYKADRNRVVLVKK